jgi:type IV secretory pathway TraG/TraD family ATPase VirD4
LRSIYGHDATVTLTSAPTTKCIMRADEPETAQWATDLLGKHEIDQMSITQLAGMSAAREAVNLRRNGQANT